MFDKIHAQRLTKLANHLLTGKLNLNSFNFGVILKKTDCGTVGCAIGECAFIFPEIEICPPEDNCVLLDVGLKGTDKKNFYAIEEFFGITVRESHYLFLGGHQDINLGNIGYLGVSATKEQVANNIIAFLKHKQKKIGNKDEV